MWASPIIAQNPLLKYIFVLHRAIIFNAYGYSKLTQLVENLRHDLSSKAISDPTFQPSTHLRDFFTSITGIGSKTN